MSYETTKQTLETTTAITTQNADPYLMDKKDFTAGGELLGKGSFAKVIKVVFRGSEAALKIAKKKNVATAEHEKKIMQDLTDFHSACIVQFLGYMSCEGRYVIAMEYMPNGSIEHRIVANKEPLPWSLRFQWITQITKALVFLHENEVVHRDIKSANILLDKDLNPKISDFGCAVKMSDGRLLEGLFGSPLWMAPEIFAQQPYGKEVDVYSMSTTIWEIVSWKQTHTNKDFLSFAKAVIQGERPKIPVNTPPKIAKYMTLGWAKRPEDRPSASELSLKLEKNADEILGTSELKF